MSTELTAKQLILRINVNDFFHHDGSIYKKDIDHPILMRTGLVGDWESKLNSETLLRCAKSTAGKQLDPEKMEELYEYLRHMLEWAEIMAEQYGNECLPISYHKAVKTLSEARIK